MAKGFDYFNYLIINKALSSQDDCSNVTDCFINRYLCLICWIVRCYFSLIHEIPSET